MPRRRLDTMTRDRRDDAMGDSGAARDERIDVLAAPQARPPVLPPRPASPCPLPFAVALSAGFPAGVLVRRAVAW
jgi:hypothetical protein